MCFSPLLDRDRRHEELQWYLRGHLQLPGPPPHTNSICLCFMSSTLVHISHIWLAQPTEMQVWADNKQKCTSWWKRSFVLLSPGVGMSVDLSVSDRSISLSLCFSWVLFLLAGAFFIASSPYSLLRPSCSCGRCNYLSEYPFQTH